jgi:hypothetical protein
VNVTTVEAAPPNGTPLRLPRSNARRSTVGDEARRRGQIDHRDPYSWSPQPRRQNEFSTPAMQVSVEIRSSGSPIRGELAERTGLTQSTLWRLDAGRPATVVSRGELAEALHVSPLI